MAKRACENIRTKENIADISIFDLIVHRFVNKCFFKNISNIKLIICLYFCLQNLPKYCNQERLNEYIHKKNVYYVNCEGHCRTIRLSTCRIHRIVVHARKIGRTVAFNLANVKMDSIISYNN